MKSQLTTQHGGLCSGGFSAEECAPGRGRGTPTFAVSLDRASVPVQHERDCASCDALAASAPQ